MWPFLNNVITTCGCTHCTPSTSICYTGVNLSCIGVNKNDTLSVALQKINALMCVPITNTEIITALGYTPANDSNVVHRTGNETIAGGKEFNDYINVVSANPLLTDNAVIINPGEIRISNTAIESPAILRADNLTDFRNIQFPDASGTIALVETVKPYKVYTALLLQVGTGTPTATVLENTLGGAVSFTYITVGVYRANLTGVFIINKTSVSLSSGQVPSIVQGARTTDNYITFKSSDSSFTPADNLLNSSLMEIRVYN